MNLLCIYIILLLYISSNEFLSPISEDSTEIAKEIRSQGYIFSSYNITTPDGYIINIWRIKNESVKSNGKVVILQHGVLDDAYTFYILQKNYSLAYVLADEGFDVWTPNVRGTIFSYMHTNKTINSNCQSEYWNFSFEEIANIDIPTIIDFIKEKTKVQKVNFIGHSQGSTIFFIKYMNDPEYIQRNINKFISLGTIVNVSNSQSLLIYLTKDTNILRYIPVKNFMCLSRSVRLIFSSICSYIPYICRKTVDNIISIQPTNRINYNKYLSHLLTYEPGGTSKKNIEHWLQCARAKKMQKFDYGVEINKILYGTDYPPEYNISNIKKWNISAIFTYSNYDSFSSEKDVKNFYNLIENTTNVHILHVNKFSHMDYLWSEDAKNEIYNKMIDFFLN